MLLLLISGALPVHAGELRVAVASNFAPVLEALAVQLRAESGLRLRPSSASSGKLYAQIRNGAPFDLFLSADIERPELLEHEGRTVPGTRFSYAVGRLVLWVPAMTAGDDCRRALAADATGRVALANPRLAPYGLAAREALRGLNLWPAVEARAVYGENIAQAFLFVHSGAASAGLVAQAQLRQVATPARGCRWLLPADLHPPIEQQAVLLIDSPDGRRLLEFLRSEAALAIISAAGYDRP